MKEEYPFDEQLYSSLREECLKSLVADWGMRIAVFLTFVALLVAAKLYLSGIHLWTLLGLLTVFVLLSIVRGGSVLPGPLNLFEMFFVMGAFQFVALPFFLFAFLAGKIGVPVILKRQSLLSLSKEPANEQITLLLRSGEQYILKPTDGNNRYDMRSSSKFAGWSGWGIGSLMREIT